MYSIDMMHSKFIYHSKPQQNPESSCKGKGVTKIPSSSNQGLFQGLFQGISNFFKSLPSWRCNIAIAPQRVSAGSSNNSIMSRIKSWAGFEERDPEYERNGYFRKDKNEWPHILVTDF